MSRRDEFDELARELRERLGPELRADAEESEALAALAARRARTLADIGRLAADRGDEVVLELRSLRVTGTVRYAAGDLLSLSAHAARLDVCTRRIAALRVVAAPTRRGADEAVPGPGGFTARLHELEMAGTVVEVLVDGHADPPRGTITVVARDHVVLVDDERREWHLHRDAIVAVRSEH